MKCLGRMLGGTPPVVVGEASRESDPEFWAPAKLEYRISSDFVQRVSDSQLIRRINRSDVTKSTGNGVIDEGRLLSSLRRQTYKHQVGNLFKFLEWYILIHLRRAGWPKRGGFLRGGYVDAGTADLFVEMGLMTLVGLGAGRPETAVKLFVTTFEDNPWTPDSTARVFRMFPPGGDDRLRKEGVLPWRELASSARLAGDSDHCPWDYYLSDPVVRRRAMAGAAALHFGLTNPTVMRRSFELWMAEHRRASIRQEQPPHLPPKPKGVDTLADFYDYCYGFAAEFNKRDPLPDIPRTLLARPEIAARL